MGSPARLLTYLTISMAAMLTSLPSLADSINPVLDDHFSFRLGGIYNNMEGTATVARPPLSVTPVDLEKVLGIDTEKSSAWASFKWRFRDRWALNFQYDRFDQSGGNIVGDPFNFDGQPYPRGAVIDTDFSADAYILDVSYNFWQGPAYEAGLGVGLHAFDIKLEIDGFIRRAPLPDITLETQTDELLAPIPNFRAYFTYALNDKMSLSLNTGWLSLEYEKWDGSFLYLKGQAEYRFFPNWGLGLGAQFTDMDIEHDSGGGKFEQYKVEFTGALVFITYSF
jgi:hypothetical protein